MAVATASRVRPRSAPATRRRLAIAGLIIAVAVGFLLWKGVAGATVYFKTADEAVAQRSSLGTKRFRVEGVVKPGTVVEAGNTTRFTIVGAGGAELAVVHTGSQPGLFRENIPVVLEGQFDKGRPVYQSDRIIVKHSETYRADNPERVKDYPSGSGQ